MEADVDTLWNRNSDLKKKEGAKRKSDSGAGQREREICRSFMYRKAVCVSIHPFIHLLTAGGIYLSSHQDTYMHVHTHTHTPLLHEHSHTLRPVRISHQADLHVFAVVMQTLVTRRCVFFRVRCYLGECKKKNQDSHHDLPPTPWKRISFKKIDGCGIFVNTCRISFPPSFICIVLFIQLIEAEQKRYMFAVKDVWKFCRSFDIYVQVN